MKLFLIIFLLSLPFLQAAFNDIDISKLTSKQGITIKSETASDLLGFKVSKAGDFNADGYEDVIVSSHNSGGMAGAVYVLFGSKEGFSDITVSSGITSKQGIVIYGWPGSKLGYSASYTGDINGDKIDDIIIGTYQSLAGQGIAYVIYGSETLPASIDLAAGPLDISQGFAIMVDDYSPYIGISVSWAGDINLFP